MKTLPVSVVIPTYNMATYLPTLWKSLNSTGITAVVQEVLFVNDGSTDETLNVLETLRRDSPMVRILNLPSNLGRFAARLKGAEAAQGSRLLFLDSRLEAQPVFGAKLAEVAAQYENVMGCVDIDVNRSVFCLYWERSHRAIFWRHYRDTRQPLTLTPENYDRYLKGTGVLLCGRELFLKACRKFGSDAPLSDDTYLMKVMVQHEPITIHPDLRISWVPREDAISFLKRLWERGPSFVEYHVFERRGPFFWVVALGLVGLAGYVALAIQAPMRAIDFAAAVLALFALSTAAFARGPGEFLKMAPLHVAVLLTFGFGILRGIGVNVARKLT